MDAALVAVGAELRAHTPAAALAGAWSEVLRHGVAAAVRLAGPADWTWFVSGSVARGEAAPGSDVETMVALGDANGVLASWPRFCRRLSSWSEGIERWAADPREDRGVVMTGLMVDSTGVWQVGGLAEDILRPQTVAAARPSYPARQAMLQDATSVRASIPSRLRMFATQSDTLDLKLAAVDPVVKIARWAAVSAGSEALSTYGRLDDAAAAKVLDPDDVSSLRDCFGWLVRFRWRMRAAAFLDGRRVSDVVSLSELAPHERAVLRNVASEVAGISRKLNYLASTSAFR